MARGVGCGQAQSITSSTETGTWLRWFGWPARRRRSPGSRAPLPRRGPTRRPDRRLRGGTLGQRADDPRPFLRQANPTRSSTARAVARRRRGNRQREEPKRGQAVQGPVHHGPVEDRQDPVGGDEDFVGDRVLTAGAPQSQGVRVVEDLEDPPWAGAMTGRHSIRRRRDNSANITSAWQMPLHNFDRPETTMPPSSDGAFSARASIPRPARHPSAAEQFGAARLRR